MSPRAWLGHPWVLRLSRWGLAAVMLGAAIPKIMDPPGFAESIHAYRIVPMAWLGPVALTLPWLEAITALGLMAGLARRSAAVLILSLLAAFIGGLSLNLLRGNPVDCGCFGVSAVQKTREQRLLDMKLEILRDLGLALLALHAIAGREPEGS